MRKKGYRVVCGLWVFPDFSEVEAGRRAPPRVDHDAVNFMALANLLKETFCYGPAAVVSAANDTIDQVTIQSRLGMIPMQERGRGDPTCRDFGHAALKMAPAQLRPDCVIDVREAWQPLHCLQDRSFAPPPTVIPFFAQAADFEDAMGWFGQCQMVMGVDVVGKMLSYAPKADDDQVGCMPAALQTGLADIFGCPFEQRVILSRLAEDTLPRYARA